jgi:hypothetical protein
VSYDHAQLTEQRDFTQVWFAARAMLDGKNSYALIGPGLAFDWPSPLLYPLTAGVAALPLALLRQDIANAVFMWIGSGGFAWALMRRGYGPLLGFASGAMFFAAAAVQWSPLLTAAVVITPLGIFFAAKPTLGVALFIVRPSRWAVVGGLVLSVLAFLADPLWVARWLDAITRNARAEVITAPYTAIVTIPGGIFALACLARWRRPEARLIVALACVPLTTLPYETVPLFLVPTIWHEALLLMATSWGAVTWIATELNPHDWPHYVAVSGQLSVLSVYLPATLMVLRRPNEGHLPAWLEQRIDRWPAWIRGAPVGLHRPQSQ